MIHTTRRGPDKGSLFYRTTVGTKKSPTDRHVRMHLHGLYDLARGRLPIRLTKVIKTIMFVVTLLIREFT